MSTFIYKARLLLIWIGKALPFGICTLSLISHAESAYALMLDRYIYFGSYIILDTPISFFIGSYFEYNLQMLLVLFVISISVETCIYNKLACIYLGVNLIEKSYFDFELEPDTIYIICMLNIAISGYLTYKGIKILTK